MAPWRKQLDASVIEASFKQVAGAYVFRYSPWALFLVAIGPSLHFRVSASQKAEIAAGMKRARERTRTIVGVWSGFAIVAAIAGAIWLATHNYPRGFLGVLIVAIIVPLYLMAYRCQVRTLGPLLNGLLRADERITYRERIEKFAGNAPFSLLLFRLVLFGALLTLLLMDLIGEISAGEWPTALVPSAIFATLFTVMTVYYAYLMTIRATANSSRRRQLNAGRPNP